MTYELIKNEQHNSIEIHFDSKPSEAIRDALKALKFRWHGVRGIWHGYADEQTTRAAIDGATVSNELNRSTDHRRDRRPRQREALHQTGTFYFNL